NLLPPALSHGATLRSPGASAPLSRRKAHMSEDVHESILKFRSPKSDVLLQVVAYRMSSKKALGALVSAPSERCACAHAPAKAGAPAGSIVSIESRGLILNQAT